MSHSPSEQVPSKEKLPLGLVHTGKLFYGAGTYDAEPHDYVRLEDYERLQRELADEYRRSEVEARKLGEAQGELIALQLKQLAHEPLAQRSFTPEEARAYRAFINEHFEAPHCSTCGCGLTHEPEARPFAYQCNRRSDGKSFGLFYADEAEDEINQAEYDLQPLYLRPASSQPPGDVG